MKNNLKIQVFGSGCHSCKKLFELTKKAVQELDINTEVEYITDIEKIIEMGVMQSPVLAVNGKPILTGSVPDMEKIKNLISASSSVSAEFKRACCADKNTCKPDDKNNQCCSSGCNC